MSAELEAKLIPGDGYSPPDLGRWLPRAVVAPQPVRHLDATYYDTADLELARWGVTLRHRSGDPGRAWTLKLPDHVGGELIAREELTFDGPEDAPPAEATDLVRGFTRGRPLERVARLGTTRAPVHVRDADGRLLVEVVHDSVTVTETGAASGDGQFREIEVEVAADDDAGHEALRSVVAALIDAGGRADPPLPKLVRALGARAQEPPSVVVDPVGRKSSTADVIRYLIAGSVSQLLVHDPGVRLGVDPEAVHQYRVATRRLRSDLRTFSQLLDRRRAGALTEELRWLGDAVGHVRDLDVLAARLTAHTDSLLEPYRPSAEQLLARVRSSRLEARRDLLDALRTERYDRTMGVLIGVASDPPIDPGSVKRSTRPMGRLAGRLVKRRWTQVAHAVKAGGAHPSDDQLHQIRIAAKRCRYAAEAVAPVVGGDAARFAAGVAKIQALLGDYNDTVVAEAWLREAGLELTECRVVIGGLIAKEQAERVRLRAKWPATWERASEREARDWF